MRQDPTTQPEDLGAEDEIRIAPPTHCQGKASLADGDRLLTVDFLGTAWDVAGRPVDGGGL